MKFREYKGNNMDLIVETDIGHDPDDFFALCYLVSAGINLRAITISPGDPDQIAIARLFCKEIGLDIPIGASKLNRTKLSSGSIHHQLLDKYGHKREAKPDGFGADILQHTFRMYPDSELFVIGPLSNLAYYLQYDHYIARATMQGGFCGYHLHSPAIRLPKFEGKTWVPTFNLNGDLSGAAEFMDSNIIEKRFVGKNICHTVVYNKEHYQLMEKPKCRAAELFMEGMGLYLERHEEKKFHDPTAAVCHLHPDIGTWIFGTVTRIESGWGTIPNEKGDWILADIDYHALWNHIHNWN
jgi:pyrimidine-specific ribonucleoside hydrolase